MGSDAYYYEFALVGVFSMHSSYANGEKLKYGIEN